MSEESVAVVRGVFEAFVSGDFERAMAAYDTDVEWDGTELPDGTIARGHDAVVSTCSGTARSSSEWAFPTPTGRSWKPGPTGPRGSYANSGVSCSFTRT